MRQYSIIDIWKTRTKSFGVKIKTKFHDKDFPDEGAHCVYFSFILLDSDVKIGKNYHLQVFLEEWKYIVKENEINKFNDKEFSSDESDYFNKSDEENE